MRILSRDNKSKIFIMLILLAIIFNCYIALAATTTKYAQNSCQYYSWCGVPIFNIGVKGIYNSDGNKIVSYSNTYCLTSTFMWTASNETSCWTYKGTYSGNCYAQAKFTLGIVSSVVTIGLQSTTVGISATATP